jgi:hypothetical protein
LENIKENTGYDPTIGATSLIGPIIKALYKAMPAIAKEDPDKTETHKARSGILEKSALSTITGVWNKQPKNSTAAIEA